MAQNSYTGHIWPTGRIFDTLGKGIGYCGVLWAVVDILYPQIFVPLYGYAGSNHNLTLKKANFFVDDHYIHIE